MSINQKRSVKQKKCSLKFSDVLNIVPFSRYEAILKELQPKL